jgi:hypothetical protein
VQKTTLSKTEKYYLCAPPIISLVAGCLSILAAIILLTFIERENYIFRIFSIGTVVCFVFLFYLFSRRAWRDPFHPDILLTIGHLAQFVIPVLLLCIFFDKNKSTELNEVLPYVPEMLTAVLIAQILLNIPFSFWRTHTERKVICHENKWSAFIILLLVAVWISRIFLVLTKSYFHTIHSDFMFTSVLHSPMSVISTLGRIVTVYTALRIFKFRSIRKEWFSIIYIVIDILWHSFSGKRAELLIAFICILLSYIFIRKKIPVLYFIILLGILVFGSAFLGDYRSELGKQASRGETISITDASTASLKKLTVKRATEIFLRRMNDGKYAAGCFKAVPDTIPFLLGKTYKMILWIPVPRVIYPNRPQFIADYNSIIRSRKGTSAPVTAVGEAYINFGWLGVCLVFPILGLIYRFMDSLFKERLSFAEAAILIFYCTLVVRMTVNPAVSQLSWMLKIILLLLFCKAFEKFTPLLKRLFQKIFNYKRV